MPTRPDPIKLFGEPVTPHLELPKSSPIGHAVLNQYVNPTQMEQALTRGRITDIDSEIFRKPINRGFAIESRNDSRSSLYTKDPLAKAVYLNRMENLIKQVIDEVNFVRELTKSELDKLSLKNKWFAGFSAGEQLILKQIMLTNPAQVFDTTDLNVPEGWLEQPFKDSLPYLPRYSNGVLQSCNLIMKDTSEAYQFYSIFVPKDSEAIYLKFWVKGHQSDFYCRYFNGEYQLVRLTLANGKLVVKVIVNHNINIEELFAFYGNVFRWRYTEYERAIAKRIPKRRVVTSAELTTEAMSLYQADMDRVTPLLFTVSNAVPKLSQYKGLLSVSTGRKMPPHDRQPHYSYRYNPDGTVRIKFPVKAAEVNGGAKTRLGLQISRLKAIK